MNPRFLTFTIANTVTLTTTKSASGKLLMNQDLRRTGVESPIVLHSRRAGGSTSARSGITLNPAAFDQGVRGSLQALR